MTATKTRQLTLVTDEYIPPVGVGPVRETVVPAGRSTHLTDEYETAQRAAELDDVQADLAADITVLMRMLAVPGADQAELLREFGTAQYVHGYVDSTTSREANLVVAEIHSLEARRAMRQSDDPA